MDIFHLSYGKFEKPTYVLRKDIPAISQLYPRAKKVSKGDKPLRPQNSIQKQFHNILDGFCDLVSVQFVSPTLEPDAVTHRLISILYRQPCVSQFAKHIGGHLYKLHEPLRIQTKVKAHLWCDPMPSQIETTTACMSIYRHAKKSPDTFVP